ETSQTRGRSTNRNTETLARTISPVLHAVKPIVQYTGCLLRCQANFAVGRQNFASIPAFLDRQEITGTARKGCVACRLSPVEKAARGGVGLSERVRDEQAAPQADLYWADDPTVAVELMRDGAVERSPRQTKDQMAEPYVDAQFPSVSLGARARVLLMNTRLVP